MLFKKFECNFKRCNKSRKVADITFRECEFLISLLWYLLMEIYMKVHGVQNFLTCRFLSSYETFYFIEQSGKTSI